MRSNTAVRAVHKERNVGLTPIDVVEQAKLIVGTDIFIGNGLGFLELHVDVDNATTGKVVLDIRSVVNSRDLKVNLQILYDLDGTGIGSAKYCVECIWGRESGCEYACFIIGPIPDESETVRRITCGDRVDVE